MASIQTRNLATGPALRLLYRADGAQRNIAMPDRDTAEYWQAVFNLHGAVEGEAMLRRALRLAEGLSAEPDDDEGGNEPAPVPQEAPAVPTVRECLEGYIEHQTAGLEPGTIDDYRIEAERDIYPYLGQRPITDLLNDDVVDNWIKILAGKHPDEKRAGKFAGTKLSGKTIGNRHALLSCGVNRAVSKGWLPANPIRGTKIPKTLKKEMVFLSTEQYGIVYTCVTPFWRPFVGFLAGTGMRFSEATALLVGDVDLVLGLVRVRRAHKWARNGKPRTVGVPKSEAGNRTIRIGSTTVAILAKQMEGKAATDLVFTNRVGKAILNNSFHSRIWGPAMAKALKAGLTVRPRPHDLRHTFAAWSLSNGKVNVYGLARVLGHENTQMVERVYGHFSPEAQNAVADAVEAKLAEAIKIAPPPRPLTPALAVVVETVEYVGDADVEAA